MTEETTPSIKDTIEEQSRLIVSLQKQLKAAIARNNAADSNQFAQAVLAATQTWKTLVDTWEDVKPKPATTHTAQPASSYQSDPSRRKAP